MTKRLPPLRHRQQLVKLIELSNTYDAAQAYTERLRRQLERKLAAADDVVIVALKELMERRKKR